MSASVPHDPDRSERLAHLCLRCQGGERAAWEELVVEFERPLLYYLRRLGASEADGLQILQDTWIEVLGSLASLSDPLRLAPWLYTVTRRVAFRSLRRPAPEPVGDALPDAPDPHAPFEAALDDAAAVHWGLARLPDLQREALTLFFLRDLSLADMADVLDVPVGTVKSRLHHARRALADILHHAETGS